MRATIRDIARETDLSITTVSLVLNGKGEKFSEATRKLVLSKAAELNYRPNQLAVSLLTKRTRTIGLILPDIRNLYFSEMAKGVEDRVQESGYSLILCNSDDRYEKDLQSFRNLADRGVDGMIVIMSAESCAPEGDPLAEMLRDSGIPAVLADSFNEVEDISSIAVDNRQSSLMAVQHLLSLGHRRIACITGPRGINTNGERMTGYRQALEEAGIGLDAALVREGDFRAQSGYECTISLLPEKPTAIFCHNDMMAYGAARALKENGLRMGKDISVMGFDDIFFSQYMDVPLTTVSQPAYDLGVYAADILLWEIKNPEAARQHVRLQSKLMVRESTAPPPEE